MIAAVWMTVSMPSTAAATVSLSQMSPSIDLQPRMLGQRGRRAVERAHLVAPLEQFRHQVGPDEAGAAGDKHTAKISRQR